MTDDVEKLEQSAKKTAGELDKLSKVSQSTHDTLRKNAKSEEGARKITNLYIRAKQEELRQLRASKQDQTDAGKIKRIQLLQELSSIRQSTRKQGLFAAVATKATTGLKSFIGAQATLVEGILAVGKGIFNTGARFMDAEQRIEGFNDAVKDFGDVPFLGKGLTALAKSADFNVGIFKQLAQTGATFESSIINLRNAAHEARMPILDFVDMVSKNSEVMGQLFGSVDAGVKRMSQFQSALRTVTQEQFAQFGLNLTETSEYFQTYLMLERARGRLVLGNTDEEIARSSHYIKNLVRLSKLTGENVDAIDKRNRELAANGVLQSQLLSLGPAQRAAINGTIASFGGADTMIGKLITQVVAFGQATETDTALLDEVARGQLIPAIRALKSGAMDVVEFQNIVGRATNEGAISDFTRSLARASIVNGENAGVVNETTRLQRARNTTDANEMAYRDTVSKSLVGMGDSLKVAKSGAESLTTGAMEFTASSMGLLEKAIATLGQNKLDGDIMKKSSMATIMAFDPSSRALRVTDKNGPADPMQIYQNTAFSNDISGEASYDGFKTGTKNVTGERFPNFGTQGTVVRVHGPEAIIPRESPMGKIVAAVDSLTVKPTVNASVTASAMPDKGNSGETDNITAISSLLSRNLDNISQIMDKSEKHLNTLVGINSTVAKNTMDTKKGLANLSTSLV